MAFAILIIQSGVLVDPKVVSNTGFVPCEITTVGRVSWKPSLNKHNVLLVTSIDGAPQDTTGADVLLDTSVGTGDSCTGVFCWGRGDDVFVLREATLRR